ncbi:phosphodiester glycosidase family protein [Candidatus Gottesmanbacteria bacterium]|nr:phosphodiester glycosidase family protein [Candidatus Gottesmanbacteria bacterium]
MKVKEIVLPFIHRKIIADTRVPITFGVILLLVGLFLMEGEFVAYLSFQQDSWRNQASVYLQELSDIKHEDQFVKNKNLQEEIANIEKTYKEVVGTYEDLVKLKEQTKVSEKLDETFVRALSELSERNFASGSATLSLLKQHISQEVEKLAIASAPGIENVLASNTPPSSGYDRQSVDSDIGRYLVDIVSADLSTTRVIVDTASDHDCSHDCPTLSLADYVSRNGAFAGVNGSYFCPAVYPSCSGKTNSFDTLLMNKNKVYFNSDNNVYSTVPAVIFGNGWIRFIGRSLDWGRDTSVDGMLANQPLLLSGGNIAFGGDDDPKKGSKGNRSFVGSRGNTVYIGVVRNVTVAESAHVLKSLGLENALNLDSGGSTALWSGGPASPSQGGYKLGPGRNIPNAILFVRK